MVLGGFQEGFGCVLGVFRCATDFSGFLGTFRSAPSDSPRRIPGRRIPGTSENPRNPSENPRNPRRSPGGNSGATWTRSGVRTWRHDHVPGRTGPGRRLRPERKPSGRVRAEREPSGSGIGPIPNVLERSRAGPLRVHMLEISYVRVRQPEISRGQIPIIYY